MYGVGERIIVDKRHSTGHCRTPSYIRGKKGVIERICGDFPNPEQIVLGIKDPEIITLYRCQFLLEDVFKNYKGSSCLLYTSPSPRDRQKSRMPSSA